MNELKKEDALKKEAELKEDVSTWMKNLEGVSQKDMTWFNDLQQLFNQRNIPEAVDGKILICQFIGTLLNALPSVESRPNNEMTLFNLTQKHDLPVNIPSKEAKPFKKP